jgi:hypothetical protein
MSTIAAGAWLDGHGLQSTRSGTMDGALAAQNARSQPQEEPMTTTPKDTIGPAAPITFHVQVGADRTLTLPAEVPVGPAEVIVVIDERPRDASGERSLLGLFADEPEIVDEAMEYVLAQRQTWRIRPAT